MKFVAGTARIQTSSSSRPSSVIALAVGHPHRLHRPAFIRRRRGAAGRDLSDGRRRDPPDLQLLRGLGGQYLLSAGERRQHHSQRDEKSPTVGMQATKCISDLTRNEGFHQLTSRDDEAILQEAMSRIAAALRLL